MELSLQTPALFFPALSLLILAYTNKFLAIANLIRKLYSDHQEKPQQQHLAQIASLKRRVYLIRWMQTCGIASIFFCVLTMFFVYENEQMLAKIVFTLALILLLVSLAISLTEIFLSTGALNVLLKDLEKWEDEEKNQPAKKIGEGATKILEVLKRTTMW